MVLTMPSYPEATGYGPGYTPPQTAGATTSQKPDLHFKKQSQTPTPTPIISPPLQEQAASDQNIGADLKQSAATQPGVIDRSQITRPASSQQLPIASTATATIIPDHRKSAIQSTAATWRDTGLSSMSSSMNPSIKDFTHTIAGTVDHLWKRKPYQSPYISPVNSRPPSTAPQQSNVCAQTSVADPSFPTTDNTRRDIGNAEAQYYEEFDLTAAIVKVLNEGTMAEPVAQYREASTPMEIQNILHRAIAILFSGKPSCFNQTIFDEAPNKVRKQIVKLVGTTEWDGDEPVPQSRRLESALAFADEGCRSDVNWFNVLTSRISYEAAPWPITIAGDYKISTLKYLKGERDRNGKLKRFVPLAEQTPVEFEYRAAAFVVGFVNQRIEVTVFPKLTHKAGIQTYEEPSWDDVRDAFQDTIDPGHLSQQDRFKAFHRRQLRQPRQSTRSIPVAPPKHRPHLPVQQRQVERLLPLPRVAPSPAVPALTDQTSCPVEPVAQTRHFYPPTSQGFPQNSRPETRIVENVQAPLQLAQQKNDQPYCSSQAQTAQSGHEVLGLGHTQLLNTHPGTSQVQDTGKVGHLTQGPNRVDPYAQSQSGQTRPVAQQHHDHHIRLQTPSGSLPEDQPSHYPLLQQQQERQQAAAQLPMQSASNRPMYIDGQVQNQNQTSGRGQQESHWFAGSSKVCPRTSAVNDGSQEQVARPSPLQNAESVPKTLQADEARLASSPIASSPELALQQTGASYGTPLMPPPQTFQKPRRPIAKRTIEEISDEGPSLKESSPVPNRGHGKKRAKMSTGSPPGSKPTANPKGSSVGYDPQVHEPNSVQSQQQQGSKCQSHIGQTISQANAGIQNQYASQRMQGTHVGMATNGAGSTGVSYYPSEDSVPPMKNGELPYDLLQLQHQRNVSQGHASNNVAQQMQYSVGTGHQPGRFEQRGQQMHDGQMNHAILNQQAQRMRHSQIDPRMYDQQAQQLQHEPWSRQWPPFGQSQQEPEPAMDIRAMHQRAEELRAVCNNPKVDMRQRQQAEGQLNDIRAVLQRVAQYQWSLRNGPSQQQQIPQPMSNGFQSLQSTGMISGQSAPAGGSMVVGPAYEQQSGYHGGNQYIPPCACSSQIIHCASTDGRGISEQMAPPKLSQEQQQRIAYGQSIQRQQVTPGLIRQQQEEQRPRQDMRGLESAIPASTRSQFLSMYDTTGGVVNPGTRLNGPINEQVANEHVRGMMNLTTNVQPSIPRPQNGRNTYEYQDW